MKKIKQYEEFMERMLSGDLNTDDRLSLAKDLLSVSSSEWSIFHQKNFADNFPFLKSIQSNLLDNETDPEILWRCIKSFGILGAKATNQECKDFCFYIINKFRNDTNKKISYFAGLEIICHFGEMLKSDSYPFEEFIKFMDRFKKHDVMLMTSYLISNRLNDFSQEEKDVLHSKFYKYSVSVKKEFYKKYFMKFTELLLDSNYKKINNRGLSIREIANEYAINANR